MAVIVNGHEHRTIQQPLYLGDGRQIMEVWVNGEKVYPEGYDNLKVVFTWNVDPSDLDSHVVGPLKRGGTFHVYFGHSQELEDGRVICTLDVDDTTGYGPETTVICPNTNGPYYFYVHQFRGSGAIATSGAKLELFYNETHLRTIRVSGTGTNKFWNAFKYQNGVIYENGSLTSNPDTSY